MLQSMLPPPPARALPPVELENVAPSLLLPPAETRARSAVVAALAGGSVELGDRVACLRVGGAPPFGARGTVGLQSCLTRVWGLNFKAWPACASAERPLRMTCACG